MGHYSSSYEYDEEERRRGRPLYNPNTFEPVNQLDEEFSTARRRPVATVNPSTGLQGETAMTNNMFGNMPGADKFMNRLFRKADGVVWDLMTGRLGIKSQEGIATLAGAGDNAQIEINLMDQFGMEVPAFAQSTPVTNVVVGDVIFFGASEKPGWIIEKKFGVRPVGSSTKKARGAAADPAFQEDQTNVQFTLMKVDGQRTTWKPPKVTMLGMESGVMVLRSLLTMLPGGNAGLTGLQGALMPMMMMGAMNGGDGGMDIESLMPMLLMGQMNAPATVGADGSAVAAPNPMAQMMPMMMMMSMMKKNNGGGGGNSGGRTGNGPFNNR